MKTFLIVLLSALSGAALVYAGTRTEVAFSQFSVCVQANPLTGGVNHVLVTAGITLDTGDPSRTLTKDVLGQLTASQKASAVTFFNQALGVIGTNQQIATPTSLPTP